MGPAFRIFQEQENNFISLQNNQQTYDWYIYSIYSWSNNPIYHNVHTGISQALDDSSFANLCISSTTTTKQDFTTTAEVLARHWNIGLETAKKTLQVTTQKGV